MKTGKIKLVSYLIVILLIVCIGYLYHYHQGTYSNEFFSIKMPKGYRIVPFGDDKWYIRKNDDEYFVATIELYKNKIENMKRSINTSKNDIEKELKDYNKLNGMNKKISVIEKEKITIIINPHRKYGEKNYISYKYFNDNNYYNADIIFKTGKNNDYDSILESLEKINLKKNQDFIIKKIKKVSPYSKEDALNDFKQLYESLEAHPNMYHSNSKNIINNKYKSIIKTIKNKN